MQYLLHDLLQLPIADRLQIIEQAISSTMANGEERCRQIQKQLNACILKNKDLGTQCPTKDKQEHKDRDIPQACTAVPVYRFAKRRHR